MKNMVRHSLLLGLVAAVAGAGSAGAAGLKWVPGGAAAGAAPVAMGGASAVGQAVPAKGPAGAAAAIIGGQEPGRQLPICRGEYNNGVHPGKLVAGKCNIGWGGKEVLLTRYELLTGPANAVQWVKTAGGKLPPAAFVGGKEAVAGQRARLLPICRAAYQNGLHPGKVVAGKCNIGWGGKEVVLPAFETMALAPAGLASGGVILKGDPRAADLAALIAALQAEKQDPKVDPLKQQALSVQKKNEQMKLAAEVLKALKAGHPITGKTASGVEIRKAAEMAGTKLSGKGEADRKALDALIAKLRHDNQAEMGRMQSGLQAMQDKRNQQYELLVGIMKKMAEVQQAMIQNMR